MHETANDPRILTAELALQKLRDNIFSKSIVRPGLRRNETNDVLSRIESQLMALKYSYMHPRDIASSEPVRAILEDAKKLYLAYRDGIEKDYGELKRANLMWAFRTFSGLSRRFSIESELTTVGVDLVAMQVRNIAKKDRYWVTRCIAGPFDMTVVTNLSNLKAGDTLAAALLPPAAVGGIVSEAMFLGPDALDAEAGAFLDPAEVDTREADGILFAELGKLR